VKKALKNEASPCATHKRVAAAADFEHVRTRNFDFRELKIDFFFENFLKLEVLLFFIWICFLKN
jgi:hypothetical protein